MARKVKQTKVAENEAQVDEQGFYYLPKALLMEYRALDSECRHIHLCLRMTSQELDALLTKHPEIQMKILEKGNLTMEARNKGESLKELYLRIEGTYPIKMSDIAIDDITGRMQVVTNGKQQYEQDGKPVYAKPAAEPVVKVRARRLPKPKNPA